MKPSSVKTSAGKEPTAKQRALALTVAAGGTSKAEAFRSIYENTPDTKRATDANASQTMKRTGFLRAMEELQAKLERPEIKDTETARKYVNSKLYDLSANSRMDQVQLQATVALGKTTLVNAFGDAPVGADKALEGSAEEIRQSIAHFIEGLLVEPENSSVVDVPRSDVSGDTNPVVIDVSSTEDDEQLDSTDEDDVADTLQQCVVNEPQYERMDDVCQSDVRASPVHISRLK